MNVIDCMGRRFGRLQVIARDVDKHGWLTWVCQCDCGKVTLAKGSNLLRGGTRSCGCLKRDTKNIKHGMRHTPEYRIWQEMKNRCSNPKCRQWDDYGGRGITVCSAWMKSFEAFYNDIGPRPSKHLTLDRIDNNGNYEPGNCRWATRTQQAQNTRRNRLLSLNGKTQTMREWANDLGINYNVIQSRLRLGWTDHQTLTTPKVYSKRDPNSQYFQQRQK